ncbi:coagulation factor XIII B chain-like [Spea bombifrons]|uniref:coagulation factor XIII B chain-like n=1 Tax=Spea bombifrons TaxID=233779 RepID=UPI0023492D2E|nr:coagulation factor XIII B chain-like [Spea bombifrons]
MKSYVFLILLVCTLCCGAQEITCDLPNVENGKIAQYFYIFKKFYFPMKEGKKLSISCAAGYTTQSGKQEETIACTSDGWEPAPICFKKCLKPSLVNGVVLNPKESYKILEKTEYSCAEGYITSSGNKTSDIICFSNGWSSQPGCHQVSDRCEAPLLNNGHYSSTKKVFRLKEVLKYKCDEGYRTASGSSSDVVECLPSGWSSTPQCTKLICEKLASVENGGFYPVKDSYVDRDVVQFFCRENYLLKGSELIQCYSFGWSPEPPTCEERRNRCPLPPRPAHAILLSDPARYRKGDTARYECDHNYILIGSEEIQCENGQWSTPPSCAELKEKIKCDKPPPTENGQAVIKLETYHSGDEVQYQCADGYEIEGPDKIICKMGKWPNPPKCTASNEYCQTPPPIRNGELVSPPSATYSTGSSVEYRCQTYHLMEGSKRVSCTHGAWSKPPTCLEPCTVAADQMRERNVELQWSFELHSLFLHGDLIELKCMDGYDMSSHSQLKGLCQRGQILYPSCRKKDNLKPCTNPPVVKSSTVNIIQESYESGSSVVYSCLEHHFLKGSSTVHCSNGEWESPPSCIEPCVLSKDEMDKNHINLRWYSDNGGYIFHGEFVEFVCKDGYKNLQSDAIFTLRGQCSYRKLNYPECVPR